MRVPTTVLSAALVLVAAIAAGQVPSPDRMFVTSASGEGVFSFWPEAEGQQGLAGANRICQHLATAAGLASPTTFRAWLSDADTDAICNIKGRSGHPPFCGSVQARNPGPWARTDGAPFARNVDALARGEILMPPLFDENGHELDPHSFQLVWTGTNASGTLSSADHLCSFPPGPAWTVSGDVRGDVGGAEYGTRRWTALGNVRCSTPAHLYCFQLTLLGGPPLAPFESPGALIFRTSTLYTGNLGLSPDAGGETGIAAGDRICQTRAAAGGLPDPASFRAWLSSGSDDALDGLGSPGPFKRPDGVRVASSQADLVDGELDAPIAQTELFTYVDGDIWTGTVNSGVVVSGKTCGDWQSAALELEGAEGFSSNVAAWSAEGELTCDSPLGLYCVSTTPVLFATGFEERGGLWRWAGVESD